MISEKWERVKDLFEAAFEYAPADRKAFLAELSNEDPLAAKQVSDLLSSYERAGDFLNQPCAVASDFLEDLEADQQRFSSGDILCGRFRIVSLIGKGGMGEVYEAWDEELEDHVALKVLRLEISTHEVFTSRFRREIQLARKVTHPNVCRIFDSFKHPIENGTYISVLSMELLQGQTLGEYLKTRGRLTAAEALPIAQQIVAGLSAIHSAGIVHRDLKPSNLTLIPDRAGCKIKITDFGIAGRLLDNLSQSPQTPASKLMGTPDYMAPEQLEQAHATVQSDVYSLGLVLYEMVTGVKPFSGESAWKRISTDPAPPRKLASDLPDSWNKTIICCLERKSKYRFPDAKTVAEGLSGELPVSPIPKKPVLLRLKTVAKARARYIVAACLLAVALSIPLLRYFNQSPEIPNGTTVLVTEISTADASLSGITVALKSQLSQSAHFEIEEDSKIVDVLKQMNRKPSDMTDVRTVREVALRSGAPLVIFGSLASYGTEYLLKMKVERVRHNPLFPAVSWEQDFPAKNKTELRDAVHNASTWIRNLAGEPAAELAHQDRPMEDTTTPSWQALQLFTDAEKKDAAGETNDAIPLLKEAIQADPDFAMAHMRLADILISQREYTEGYPEWQKAIALTDKHQLTSRESLRIEGQYYEDTGDYAQAEIKFHEYTIHYPSDYLAWFFWGSILDSMNRKEEALKAFAQALVLKPDSSTVQAHMVMVYLVLGQYDEAQKLISEIKAQGDADLALWLWANLAFLKNDVNLAQAFADRMTSSSSDYWRSRGFIVKARFFAEMGQFQDAAFVLNKGIAFDESHGRAVDNADKHIALGYLFYREGNLLAAQTEVLKASELDRSPRQLMEAGSILARTNDISGARQLLRELDGVPDFDRVRLARSRLLGEIELASGRPQKAVKYFRKASVLARPNECLDYMARALVASGNTQAAQTIWRSVEQMSARLLLYPDSSSLDLWGESLEQMIQHSSTTRPDVTCDLARRYMLIHEHADAGVRQQQLQSVRSYFSRRC